MTDSNEEIAKRLAERGPEALLARMREAYRQAAATHADVIELDDARIEELIQRSVERADGLQWRRALADAAADELGIGLVEALHHPAVVLAQEMVGAPSYEDSLAELTGRTPGRGRGPGGEGATGEDGDGADADDPGFEEDEDGLRVTAIHLGGVANLPTWQSGIKLRVSADGLDIIRDEDDIVGRLGWDDIDQLEVPVPRARRRRHSGRARLVIRTGQGDASFEIPAFSGDELRERLDPLVERFRAS